MSKKQFFLGIFLSSLFGALISCALIFTYLNNSYQGNPIGKRSISQRQQMTAASMLSDSLVIVPEGLNFIHAASKVVPGVVHIRALYSSGQYSINPLDGLYRGPSQSSGSGVIITDDGYLVTNNHVIESASQIEVVLNDNRTYLAKLVGSDPTTDLALLKINETNLSYVSYGDSDRVLPGEWVLAIGNPFDLNSTVTAGIVSAKARNIGILRDKNNLQIESFIQTDAAVNPGNSGGALVNLRGELIGINTAIATPTGSYSGYSFAVPVTLVKKVMDDLLEFGAVQRGLLGIRIGDMNAAIAHAQGIDIVSGVFISAVNRNSSAEDAGLREGDIIIKINGTRISNVSELQEMVARNRPGDDIKVTYVRNGEEYNVEATLKNTEGNTGLLTDKYEHRLEGATLENLALNDLSKYDIDGGVRLKSIDSGKWKDAGIPEGFIVTSVDKVEVLDIKDLNIAMENKKGGLLLEGVYPDGERGVFGIDW